MFVNILIILLKNWFKNFMFFIIAFIRINPCLVNAWYFMFQKLTHSTTPCSINILSMWFYNLLQQILKVFCIVLTKTSLNH